MTIYPTVRPSLTLDFKKSKQLDPRISFSRSSTATYVEAGVIKTADEHQARFEDDGLLIEESRTNIFDQSEDIETWTSGLWTKTNNVAISPDGTQTAGSLVPNVGTTSQSSGRTVTQSAGNHVCSVFAKPNGLTVLKIRFSGSSYQAFFNLTGNGSVASQSNGTASISKRPDGWYKCIFTINDTVGETDQWQIGHDDSSNVDGTNGFYIWGMQVEQSTFPTSYIPTSGSTVTRSEDIATISEANFTSLWTPNAGTWFVYGGPSYLVTVNSVLVRVDANSSAYSMTLNVKPSDNRLQFAIKDTGTTSGDINNTEVGIGSISSLAWDTNSDNTVNIRIDTEGLFEEVSTPRTLNALINKLQLGNYRGQFNFLNGHISRFAYYPERLTNEQLEAITS